MNFPYIFMCQRRSLLFFNLAKCKSKRESRDEQIVQWKNKENCYKEILLPDLPVVMTLP